MKRNIHWILTGLLLVGAGIGDLSAQPSPGIVCNQDYYNATRYLGARNSARSINGEIIVVFEPASGYTNQDIWYSTWNPFFQEWDPPQQLSFSPQGYTGIPAVVADEDGNIWAGWKQQNAQGDRDMAACQWDGFSWGVPVVADDMENNAGVNAIDLADDGTIFNICSIWNDPPEYDANIYASWSRDGGETWETQNLTSEFPTPDYLPLNYLDVNLAPGLDGTMWAAWEDKPYDTSWEILLSHFDGESWSVPEVVSPIEDIEGTVNYVDGCTPAPGSEAVFVMGPDTYELAGAPAMIMNPDQSHRTLSSFFNLRYIAADNGRDELVQDALNWFNAQNILVVDDDNRYDHESYLYESLDNIGATYSTFDCGTDTVGVEQIPTLAELSAADLVIWFCGDDGGSIGLWNGNETDNQPLINYLEASGQLWVIGLDFLYDRYQGAPDEFAPGDFVYDYLGIASYDSQSGVDDNGEGVAQLDLVQGNDVTDLETITWSTTGAIRQGEPSIATTPDGDLHMVYVSESHIWYQRYDGENWTDPLQMDTTADTLSSYRPNISCDENWGVYVVWNQVQELQPRLTNIFYTTSPDGGETWNTPQQLSAATYANDLGNSVFNSTIGRKVRPAIDDVFDGGADVNWVQWNAESALGYDVMYGRIPYVGELEGVNNDQRTPQDLLLVTAYPNPFNPETRIQVETGTPGTMELTVWNLNGQRVATLNHGFRSAGIHEFTWNASGLASGIYLLQAKTKTQQTLQKLTLLK